MKVKEMGTATEAVEATETTLADRQEQALERLLTATDFLGDLGYLTDKEVVEIGSVAFQARKGMARKAGLTRRERQLLKGIFILLGVVKRLLLLTPKAELKK